MYIHTNTCYIICTHDLNCIMHTHIQSKQDTYTLTIIAGVLGALMGSSNITPASKSALGSTNPYASRCVYVRYRCVAAVVCVMYKHLCVMYKHRLCNKMCIHE